MEGATSLILAHGTAHGGGIDATLILFLVLTVLVVGAALILRPGKRERTSEASEAAERPTEASEKSVDRRNRG